MPLPIFSGGGILLILNDLHNKKDTQQTFYKLFKTHNYEKTFIRSTRSCWNDSMRAE